MTEADMKILEMRGREPDAIGRACRNAHEALTRYVNECPKRYDVYGQESYGETCTEVDENKDGRWVKWDDIKHLFISRGTAQK